MVERHDLRGIGVRRAVSTILVKVLSEILRILPNITKIYGLTAVLQQQQAFEILEEGRIRLMYCTENGLPSS